MSYAGAQPLTPWRWLGVPLAQAMALTVLFAIPLRLFGLQLPEPVFALPLAFAWVIIRPSVLAPFAVLLMGLFLDAFWGSRLGLWAVSLLTGYGVALACRSMMAGQSRLMLWAWYGLICVIAMAMGSFICVIETGAAPSPFALGWQFLATVLLYPIADTLIGRFEDADVRFR